MAIIVLRELRKELSEDFGPGDPLPYIEVVHAAPADPDVSGDPGDRTFCGKPTLDMERVDYRPAGPPRRAAGCPQTTSGQRQNP